MGRGIRFTTEFKREAVRLVLSSGRPRTEIAEDLGVGLSSLGSVNIAVKTGSVTLPICAVRRQDDIDWAFFANRREVDKLSIAVPRRPNFAGAPM